MQEKMNESFNSKKKHNVKLPTLMLTGSKDFDKDINQQDAENIFIYGKPVQRISKKGNISKKVYYTLDDDPCYLHWTSHKKNHDICKIRLTDIMHIDETPHKKNQIKKGKVFICISIKNQENDIVIAFDNEREKHQWGFALKLLITKAFQIEKDEKMQDEFKHLAQTIFNKADVDGSKALDYKETEQVLKQLHVKFSKQQLQSIFKKFDTDGSQSIDLNEFRNILQELMKKKELNPLYQQYCSSMTESRNQQIDMYDHDMTSENIHDFLKNEQGYFIPVEAIRQNILNKSIRKQSGNESMDLMNENPSISFYHFSNMIFSTENSLFDPEKSIIYQNMNRPLTDYYINSSHNTYLSGDQLVGDSDINQYKKVLLKGCRCVELDTWDGNNEPIITHGHTLTSKIRLYEALEVIKKYAFQTSPYPVILSFENHCGETQTKIIAAQLKQIFGVALYLLPINYDKFKYFKSPASLKYKVIVKSKSKIFSVTDFADKDHMFDNFTTEIKFQENLIQKGKQNKSDPRSNSNSQSLICNGKNKDKDFERNASQCAKEKENSTELESDTIDSYRTTFEEGNHPFPHGGFKFHELNFNQIYDKILKFDSMNDIDQMLTVSDSDEDIKSKSNSKSNFQEDAEMVNLTTMFGMKMDVKDLKQRTCFHISSIDEDKTEKYVYDKDKENVEKAIDFHKQFFSRVYPKGTRVDSSNYDSTAGFAIGSQVVALNFQMIDFNLFMYLAKFQANGGSSCGYVLKPEWQRSDCRPHKAKYPFSFEKPQKKLQIKLISGQSLQYDSDQDKRDFISPYVKIEVKGLPIDEKNNKTFRSKVISQNNLDPQFDQMCSFDIYCPDLAMLVFQVLDDNNSGKLISWYALPIECIRNGYRVVPLQNSQLYTIEHSYLFVNVKLT